MHMCVTTNAHDDARTDEHGRDSYDGGCNHMATMLLMWMVVTVIMKVVIMRPRGCDHMAKIQTRSRL